MVYDKFESEDQFWHLSGMKLIELQSDFARATFRVTADAINTNRMVHLAIVYLVEVLACEAVRKSCGEQAEVIQYNINFLATAKCGDILDVKIKEIRQLDYIRTFEFDVMSQKGQLFANGVYHLNLKE